MSEWLERYGYPNLLRKVSFSILECVAKKSSRFLQILECWLAINGYVLSLTRSMDGLLDTLFYQVRLYLVFLDTIQILD